MFEVALPGLLDAVLHVLFAAIAMLILFPRRNSPWVILAVSVIMEVLTDGAHIVNKDITHNIFFFLEVPLMLMFVGYLINKPSLEGISLLMLAANITHFLMDAAMEGDALALYYPLMSGTYTWDFTLFGSPILAGFAVWLSIMLVMKLVVRLSGLNPLQFPPLSHI